MNLEEFKESLIVYLESEKKFLEQDILSNDNLSDKEKVDKGILVEEASLIHENHPLYELQVSENNTKLRPGDLAYLVHKDEKFEVKILENASSTITLEVKGNHKVSKSLSYRLEIKEIIMLQNIISLANNIREGYPGAYWIKVLTNVSSPVPSCQPSIKPPSDYSEGLNEIQEAAINKALERPSHFCIQGPPGTGKTDVLSRIVYAYAHGKEPNEVLILCPTHQAVNNALNKIIKQSPQMHVAKIGEDLKAFSLDERIVRYSSFKKYTLSRKGRKPDRDVIGMTFHSAVINLGLRTTIFHPSVVIIDEAGQIPLTFGSLIGLFGSPSIILIGDDKQMPPIFHTRLEDNVLSQSIFSYVANTYPELSMSLETSYRMNDEITALVSSKFYEPFGIKLNSSEFSAHRRLKLDGISSDLRINAVLFTSKSIHYFDVSSSDKWEDCNPEEAEFVVSLVNEALKHGMNDKEIAVITPFRRQVKLIRENLLNSLNNQQNLPLIDTVERMQGQDVEMIIISSCTTNCNYYNEIKSFLLNPNRLNVMISRAKTKVVVLSRFDML